MQHADILLTLAEVSIALAGFSSIISVFRKRSRPTLAQDAFRFRGIIENSLVLLGFSLLPLIINSYGLREAVSWRVSSVAFLVVYGSVYIVSLRRLRQLLGPSWIREWPFSLAIGFIAGLAFVFVTLLNAFSITPQLASALYLTALCCPLIPASMLFMHYVLFSVGADLES